MLYGIAKPIAVALMRLTCGLEVRGREHVPALGPLLVVSNHVSVLDPPFVGGACPRELYYLAKEELFAVPLFGRLIRALNARPVKRDGLFSRKAATPSARSGVRTAIAWLRASMFRTSSSDMPNPW